MVPGLADKDRGQLESGISRLGIETTQGQTGQLLAYLELIRRWSAGYNLVSAGELNELVTRHLLDSLAIRPFIGPGRLLDVGSGAGFPGVPLAVLGPGLEVTLLDSSGKKVRFLGHVRRSLGLANIHPVHERIESFSPGLEFSTITSRAFSSLRTFVESTRHLARPETQLLAMKGKYPHEEMSNLPDWGSVRCVEALEVPGLHAQRHLVVMHVSNGSSENTG